MQDCTATAPSPLMDARVLVRQHGVPPRERIYRGVERNHPARHGIHARPSLHLPAHPAPSFLLCAARPRTLAFTPISSLMPTLSLTHAVHEKATTHGGHRSVDGRPCGGDVPKRRLTTSHVSKIPAKSGLIEKTTRPSSTCPAPNASAALTSASPTWRSPLCIRPARRAALLIPIVGLPPPPFNCRCATVPYPLSPCCRWWRGALPDWLPSVERGRAWCSAAAASAAARAGSGAAPPPRGRSCPPACGTSMRG